jgi:hypothetical protein
MGSTQTCSSSLAVPGLVAVHGRPVDRRHLPLLLPDPPHHRSLTQWPILLCLPLQLRALLGLQRLRVQGDEATLARISHGFQVQVMIRLSRSVVAKTACPPFHMMGCHRMHVLMLVKCQVRDILISHEAGETRETWGPAARLLATQTITGAATAPGSTVVQLLVGAVGKKAWEEGAV